ncbi:DUF2460 domain-containing protein [Burkholderia pseudomallei]|uniref:DUF2460 domain-containing protein n=1 Tax=Burkholderia pseudomallei TaxID=28450 RepID=UPI000A1A3080|nr:DUF2460 domain-containing protein [Burkholderia pseudomallei]ARL25495.1 hypothetical protein BOC47_24295 [Burkholderia pseudomallei]ARL77607.1 hypothetical protein BOC54_37055 [Burkholderia pseudomallei]ARL84213.1 hypothetical protein BOC55_35380 [Burkholderia pseudomallei]
MTTFLESPRFPDNIAFGATVGPTYLTVLNTLYSGRDSSIVAWTQARIHFDVGRRSMNAIDTATLDAFFRAVKGRAYRFRIKDWTDFACTTANGMLTKQSAGIYQLGKLYTTGTLSETRTIAKPVVGTVVVYKNGVQLTSGYSLDSTTGLVTISPAPLDTDTLAWVGQFDVPARFDTDEMKKQVMDRNGANGDLLVDWGSIPIIEVRP